MEIDLRYCNVHMISFVSQYWNRNHFFASNHITECLSCLKDERLGYKTLLNMNAGCTRGMAALKDTDDVAGAESLSRD